MIKSVNTGNSTKGVAAELFEGFEPLLLVPGELIREAGEGYTRHGAGQVRRPQKTRATLSVFLQRGFE